MRKRYRLHGAAVVVLVAITACLSVTLGEHEQALTQLDTTSYAFGNVPLGMGSMSPPINVSPSTMADDDFIDMITFDSTCPDFQLHDGGGGMGMLFMGSDGGLHAGSAMPPHVFWMCFGGSGSMMVQSPQFCNPVRYPFFATFTPSNTTPQSCVARVYTHSGSGGGNGSGNTVTFTGSGFAPSYGISADMTSLNFGTVNVGQTSGAQTVTITNTGSASVDVFGTNSDAITYNVNPPLGTPVTLAAHGDVQPYTVTCNPQMPRSYPAMLQFKTGSTQGNITVPVTLSCFGGATTFTYSPNPIAFGTKLVGQSPTVIPVTITLGGNATGVVLDNFSFAGSPTGRISYNPNPPMPTTLASSGSFMTVDVQYDPSAEDTSGSLGQLTFTADGNPYSVPITGKALLASLGTNPAAVDFGPVCAGTGSAQDVTIQTNADGPVNVTALGQPQAPFGATSTTIPMQLGGNGVGMITVHATISTQATTMAGSASGMFTLTTDVPGTPTRAVPLTATVISAGLTPTPLSVSFGPIQNGGMSEGKMVVVSNCGADDTLADARLTGASPNDFTIESPANPGSLNKHLGNGESQAFLVQLTPHSSGAKNAVLLIEHNGNPIQVPLDGAGFGGSDATGGERETYYACSTGRPVTLAPIALALLVLRRRRRT